MDSPNDLKRPNTAIASSSEKEPNKRQKLTVEMAIALAKSNNIPTSIVKPIENDANKEIRTFLKAFMSLGLEDYVTNLYSCLFKYTDYVHMSHTNKNKNFYELQSFATFHQHEASSKINKDMPERHIFSFYLAALRAKEGNRSFWQNNIEEYPPFCMELIRAERYEALLASLETYLKFRPILKHVMAMLDNLTDDAKQKFVVQCYDLVFSYQTAQTNAAVMITHSALQEEFQKKYGAFYEANKKKKTEDALFWSNYAENTHKDSGKQIKSIDEKKSK